MSSPSVSSWLISVRRPLVLARSRSELNGALSALGVLTLVALASAKGVDDIILATVSVRFKYYLILTFCMNVICAGESPDALSATPH